VERLTEAGCDRITFYIRPEDAGQTERSLDRKAELTALATSD